jgi:hypothetical protein
MLADIPAITKSPLLSERIFRAAKGDHWVSEVLTSATNGNCLRIKPQSRHKSAYLIETLRQSPLSILIPLTEPRSFYLTVLTIIIFQALMLI